MEASVAAECPTMWTAPAQGHLAPNARSVGVGRSCLRPSLLHVCPQTSSKGIPWEPV